MNFSVFHNLGRKGLTNKNILISKRKKTDSTNCLAYNKLFDIMTLISTLKENFLHKISNCHSLGYTTYLFPTLGTLWINFNSTS